MPLHRWVRLLLGLMAVPLALGLDTAYDAVDGRRFCLDHAVAATSPDLTETLCHTIGIDGGALPDRLVDVVGRAVGGAWGPVEGELRRAWARLG
ncbi:hypothetical protein [Nocardioides sp.]|uniref:hypothetical protein n=1 Tax=Nocardioides sp. TaxID=35761 RepID=UPI0026382069|nr:hypothetical protein [Nocardioides sp.]